MKKISAFIMSCFICLSVFGQTDTIRLKDKRMNTGYLKPGLNQYLVYVQNPKNKKVLTFSLWMRNIQIEERNGEKIFAITQHWYSVDSSRYRYIYSLNRA